MMCTTHRSPRFFSAFFHANFDRCTVENFDRYKDGVVVLIDGVLVDRGCVAVERIQILIEPIDFTRTSGNDVPDWQTFSKYLVVHRKNTLQ